MLELHVALGRREAQTIEALLASPVIHLDETSMSMRVDGKNQWAHVVSAGDRVLKRVHPNRGLAAMLRACEGMRGASCRFAGRASPGARSGAWQGRATDEQHRMARPAQRPCGPALCVRPTALLTARVAPLPSFKVMQKVSGTFGKARYAQAYCRISSYLQSMAYRGINPLVAIQSALSGQLYAEG